MACPCIYVTLLLFNIKLKESYLFLQLSHFVSLRRRIEIFAIPDVVVHQREEKFGKNGERKDQNKSPKIHKIIRMMFLSTSTLKSIWGTIPKS